MSPVCLPWPGQTLPRPGQTQLRRKARHVNSSAHQTKMPNIHSPPHNMNIAGLLNENITPDEATKASAMALPHRLSPQKQKGLATNEIGYPRPPSPSDSSAVDAEAVMRRIHELRGGDELQNPTEMPQKSPPTQQILPWASNPILVPTNDSDDELGLHVSDEIDIETLSDVENDEIRNPATQGPQTQAIDSSDDDEPPWAELETAKAAVPPNPGKAPAKPRKLTGRRAEDLREIEKYEQAVSEWQLARATHLELKRQYDDAQRVVTQLLKTGRPSEYSSEELANSGLKSVKVRTLLYQIMVKQKAEWGATSRVIFYARCCDKLKEQGILLDAETVKSHFSTSPGKGNRIARWREIEAIPPTGREMDPGEEQEHQALAEWVHYIDEMARLTADAKATYEQNKLDELKAMRAMSRMRKDREDEGDTSGSGPVLGSARKRKGGNSQRDGMYAALTKAAEALSGGGVSEESNNELKAELERQKRKLIKLDNTIFDLKKAQEEAIAKAESNFQQLLRAIAASSRGGGDRE
jgi:hypothetical protein